MEWIDEAIILSARPHGENAMIVDVMTESHGRHAGLVAGGQSHKKQNLLQPGNHVRVVWRARLLDHLGNFNLELVTTTAAAWLDEPEILHVIASASAMTEAALPERQPMPGVYAGLRALFALEDRVLWGPIYVKWELGLLRALGFGLDLDRCAVSGESEDLAHVSPRTGRAVSRSAGQPYQGKLLTLPAFLTGAANWTDQDILQGLELTGHFFIRHVFAHNHGRMLINQAGDLPPARERLKTYYRAQAAKAA